MGRLEAGTVRICMRQTRWSASVQQDARGVEAGCDMLPLPTKVGCGACPERELKGGSHAQLASESL